MALTLPRTDLYGELRIGVQKFLLKERQEHARNKLGQTFTKSLGSALWYIEVDTLNVFHDASIDIEAMLHSLDGGIHGFYAYDVRRPYPKAYPLGDFTDSGEINSVDSDNVTLTLKSLPANFQLTRGDYFSFNYGSPASRALHQVMESVTADGSGITPEFAVRPHLRPGVAEDIAVSFKKPSALFRMIPDSEDQSVDILTTGLSFAAIQSI